MDSKRLLDDLSFAVCTGDIDAVRDILSANANNVNADSVKDEIPILWWAVHYGHFGIVRYLLNEAGADFFVSMPISWRNSFFDLTAVVENQTTILHLLGSRGKLDNLNYLLNDAFPRAVSNHFNSSPLLTSPHLSDVQYLERLRVRLINTKDHLGLTILQILASVMYPAQLRVVKSLLDYGAEVDAVSPVSDMRTALEFAMETQEGTEKCRMLLQYGASVNCHLLICYSRHCVGSDATQVRVRSAANRFLQLVLDNGADLEEKDSSGRTALHFSVSKNHPEIALFLLKAGASVHALVNAASETLNQLAGESDSMSSELAKALAKAMGRGRHDRE